MLILSPLRSCLKSGRRRFQSSKSLVDSRLKLRFGMLPAVRLPLERKASV